MGLDYSLKLTTHMSRDEVLALFAEHIPRLQRSEDRISLYDSGVIIAAVDLDQNAQAIIQDAFGFSPQLSVLFRHPSNEDYDYFVEMMLKGTLLLLEHATDAVLLFGMEITVLQRTEGHLVFNSDCRIWEDEQWLRAHVAVPFERRPLPSPLL